MFTAAFELISHYGTIVIHRHQKPDGDALGSQIGLCRIIKDNFPEKKVFAVGDGAGRYSFMEGSEADVISDDTYNGALAVILDTSSAKLISDARYTAAEATLRIDHHVFIEKIADTEVVDTSFESCCGMITAFALECGLVIGKGAATALYTGMATDSGRFRYDSTSPRTFALASSLLERGVDISEIYRNLYSDDYESIRLRAQYVMKIKFSDRNTAYIYTTKEELDASGADSFSISRGMVGVMADIKGIDIWVNFTETDNGVLCEIRSSVYNVCPVAVRYGGGGHEKACGATLRDRNEAMALLADLDKVSLTEEK